MHLPRPPAFDHGVISALWGIGLGVFIWLGLVSVGVSKAESIIFGALSAFAIFLFVRFYGDEAPRQQPDPPANPPPSAR